MDYTPEADSTSDLGGGADTYFILLCMDTLTILITAT